jgi:hypothetical protein
MFLYPDIPDSYSIFTANLSFGNNLNPKVYAYIHICFWLRKNRNMAYSSFNSSITIFVATTNIRLRILWPKSLSGSLTFLVNQICLRTTSDHCLEPPRKNTSHKNLYCKTFVMSDGADNETDWCVITLYIVSLVPSTMSIDRLLGLILVTVQRLSGRFVHIFRQ